MSEHTPSQAALMAAVELEIEGCIGCITTQGLALKIDAVAAASNEAKIATLTKALEEARDGLLAHCAGSVPETLRRIDAALSSHTEQEG